MHVRAAQPLPPAEAAPRTYAEIARAPCTLCTLYRARSTVRSSRRYIYYYIYLTVEGTYIYRQVLTTLVLHGNPCVQAPPIGLYLPAGSADGSAAGQGPQQTRRPPAASRPWPLLRVQGGGVLGAQDPTTPACPRPLRVGLTRACPRGLHTHISTAVRGRSGSRTAYNPPSTSLRVECMHRSCWPVCIGAENPTRKAHVPCVTGTRTRRRYASPR